MSEISPGLAVPRCTPRLSRRRLGWLLLVVVIVVIVFSGVVYLRQKFHEQRCRRHLETFSKFMMFYPLVYEHLPPAYVMDSTGRRMHSWRGFVSPFVDWNDLRYRGYMYNCDEPWGGPTNTLLLNKTGYYIYYSCPTYAEGSHNASYLCVVGGALWPVPKIMSDHWNEPSWPDIAGEGGVLPSSGKAILLVEVVESIIPWTKPEDISLSEITALLQEDPKGDLFRRRIRNVVVVDAKGVPSILDPARDLIEIKAVVETENSRGGRVETGTQLVLTSWGLCDSFPPCRDGHE